MTIRDIRPALRAYLLADADVSEAVGENRIYPSTLPQKEPTLPAVVLNLVTETTDYHMQGPSGLVQARYQVDCWARTPDDAVDLAALVKDRLSGLRGAILASSSSPSDEVEVRGLFADQGSDDYDSVADLYTRRRDYLIWYTE